MMREPLDGLGFTSVEYANRRAKVLMRQGYTISMTREPHPLRHSGWVYTVWITQD